MQSLSLSLWLATTATMLVICTCETPVPLETVVMQQAETISQLQAKLTSMETELASLKTRTETKVAFNARLTGTNQDFTEENTIIFDHVDLNQGSGYDKITGVFTAPASGLYVFSLKIAHTPPGSFHVVLLKERQEIAEVDASGDDVKHPDRSSCSVVVQLSAGQRVWPIRRDSDSTVTNIQGDWRSSFMGVLVKVD